MRCDKCSENIAQGEDRQLHGLTLCEDCYIDGLSPAKACDPWAVYSAKSFSTQEGSHAQMTETQSKILQIIEEIGEAEPNIISARLQIDPSDLKRDIATLRHMEKIRGELRNGKKIYRLW